MKYYDFIKRLEKTDELLYSEYKRNKEVFVESNKILNIPFLFFKDKNGKILDIINLRG